jgi:transposase
MTMFPEIAGVLIEQIRVAYEVTLTGRTTSPTALCPSCGTNSERVQSRYTRRLHDLPASGRPVHLNLQVRRFFCTKSTCAQKIFAERLPELCRPHAQRTLRLQEALSQLGLLMGGQAGARLGNELGINGSRDTILRLVRRHPLPNGPAPRIIGLDDWSWKRRLRYGTLICDLERSVPIEVLPDRSVETVAAWLAAHPTVELVSRDGSSEYASAIKKGAPQARQVSDRWHLTKNLAGCVSVVLAASLTEIRRAVHPILPAEDPTGSVVALRPVRTRAVQQVQQTRQEEREQRYQTIIALGHQGMKSKQIAERLGMGERTVRHWLSSRGLPYARPRNPRPRLIDAYAPYLALRWEEGCRNGSQLEKEVRARGYTGSQRGIYRYLETLEPSGFKRGSRRFASAPRPVEAATAARPALMLSPQRATWLFFRRKADLKQEELTQLHVLLQGSSRAQTTYQLVETFLHMVRERQGEQLDTWLEAVQASQLEAFASFVTSIQQDKDAVLAGLTLPWSTGPLEGHINRLKLIKRQGYGRAKFDLLRLRVLWTPKRKQQGTRKPERNAGASAQEKAS